MATQKLITWDESASHPNLVRRAGLRSSDTTLNGDGIGDGIIAGAGVVIGDYNIDAIRGVNPQTPAQGIRYNFGVLSPSLDEEHYYHIEVSKEHFIEALTTTEYLMSNGSSGITHQTLESQGVEIGT
ncbi:MAG: hypothetical protein ACR2PH_10725, partial [Desulfobulbia bacterium]